VWDARRGAQELFDVYSKIGLQVDDFEGVRYKRIAHVKWLIAQGLLDESLRWTAAPASMTALSAGATVGVA
jgi:hypothetical protein